MKDDLIQLHEWEDALNMELEYREECECQDPECDGECENIGDLIDESRGFNMWRRV